MINNRQGNRRRGRGGQRPSGSGQPGNRQDNRQRGNAAQLLEKYKSMARDSQLSGDRVQTEYYLQFADHYFRVLNENKPRPEDQRRPQGDDDFEDDGEEAADSGDEQSLDQGDDDDRGQRDDRTPRPDRSDRDRSDRRPRYARDEGDDRSNGSSRVSSRDDKLPMDALPPAIGRDDAPVDVADDVEASRPRRTRRPRAAKGDGDVAPAA